MEENKTPHKHKMCIFGGRSGMQCKAPDAPQYEYCKRPATPQCVRYGRQNCATYICAMPYYQMVLEIAQTWTGMALRFLPIVFEEVNA